METLEKRKSEITKEFDKDLPYQEVEKLSYELHGINDELQHVEERWMELSERL